MLYTVPSETSLYGTQLRYPVKVLRRIRYPVKLLRTVPSYSTQWRFYAVVVVPSETYEA